MEQHLTEAEESVAELVWQQGPLPSGELVALCARQLGWKKSTTYTILKRLEGKGVLRNESGQVAALISREEYQSVQGWPFIDGASAVPCQASWQPLPASASSALRKSASCGR